MFHVSHLLADDNLKYTSSMWVGLHEFIRMNMVLLQQVVIHLELDQKLCTG